MIRALLRDLGYIVLIVLLLYGATWLGFRH
jgi:hypothetical protein